MARLFPLQLSPPLAGGSGFQLEILAEAEQELQNPILLRDQLLAPGGRSNPIIIKYVDSGLNREAVPFAVSACGDDSTK
ncbi:hypothetical protein SAY87_008208 [Trapa incisa]|uniref:Uncharacterized protein n=1 Tax=Trapa incisa TaxID=236973 RepID=A0AAN7KM89_9MYRT|nr:hypothetical protein SAY87_008208 [Trapa incisa]